MASFLEFKSTTPGEVGDLTRLSLIREELQVIYQRIMQRVDSDPYLESAVADALS